MSKIKLFHSYLYIDKTNNLKIKNNKIYDNNNFICGLLNIPNKCEGIKIILEKNLVKNKFSKKIINTYYEKNNLKVYVEFDTKNIKTITLEKNIFIKMCEENYINYVNINQKLLDVVCINKKYNKQLFNSQLIDINNNCVKIYDLYLDLKKKTINESHFTNNKNIKINYNILYTDYLLGTIFYLNKYKLENTCVVCDDTTKKLWDFNSIYKVFTLNSFINLNNKTKFNNIILCDIDYYKLNNKDNKILNYFNYIIYICSISNNKTIKNFLDKVYYFSNLQSKQIECNYKITNEQLYNFSKCLCVFNFFENMLKKQEIQKIIVNKSKGSNILEINKLIKKIKFNISVNTTCGCNTTSDCNICLENINEVNFLYLDCGHKFCYKCITKILDYKLNCSICRSKINSINKNINLDNFFKKNYWFYVGNILKSFFFNIKKYNNNLIYLENKELYLLIIQIIKYIKPDNDYNLICLDINKNLPELEIEKNKNVNLFYLKSKDMVIDSNNLCLYLKNFYKKVKIFEYNITDY